MKKVYRDGFKHIVSWFLIGIFCVWFSLSSTAQLSTKGRLSGKAQDAKTGLPLYGANIMVKGTVLGSSANETGVFRIEGLPVGSYTIEASMMGYVKQTIENVQILPGRETEILFRLEPTVLQQPALIITATKRKQSIEDAPTSVDVLNIHEIQNRSVITIDQALQNTAGFGVIKGQIDLRGSTGFNWSAGSRVLLMI